MRYDVFNGDADGICALHQLRLHTPAQAKLVTGVKRDIELLRRVPCGAGTYITVLDVSLDSNAEELLRLLDDRARVTYFDHHSADRAFAHPGLSLHCDTAVDVCTSILVDRHLGGLHRPWAVAAAFGDNLAEPASRLAQGLGLHHEAVAALAQLGQVFNYNAYGESVEDLHMDPVELYLGLAGYADPFDFIADSAHYRHLSAAYRDDCAQMHMLLPYWERCGTAIYLLPPTRWARRISGVLANQIAAKRYGGSFAVLNERSDGDYLVSIRSGAPSALSACGFCKLFDTGGGRKAAAGINRLPARELDRFIACFQDYFTASTIAGHAT